MFFDQYNTKKRGMRPSLIITNNKLDMTVKSSNLPRLDVYLNTVNQKNDFSNTIWFGIVPAIEMESVGKPKVVRKLFQGNVEVKNLEPLIINVSECYECRHLPYLGRPACAFDAGILEALFSSYYNDKRAVTETKCYAMGDKYCSFVIDEAEQK